MADVFSKFLKVFLAISGKIHLLPKNANQNIMSLIYQYLDCTVIFFLIMLTSTQLASMYSIREIRPVGMAVPEQYDHSFTESIEHFAIGRILALNIEVIHFASY